MPTPLRHDLEYLKRLLTHAIRLHRPGSAEEARMPADLRDHTMYVALDALEDAELAKRLMPRFSQLQAWLERRLHHTPVWRDERETIRFYIGWLFALEQLLSLRHETAKLPSEAINREDFKRSWAKTAEKLGL
jgi:hypothetical protein